MGKQAREREALAARAARSCAMFERAETFAAIERSVRIAGLWRLGGHALSGGSGGEGACGAA